MKLNETESKLAARIHVAEGGRTHKIEYVEFGPKCMDYMGARLRTVREIVTRS